MPADKPPGKPDSVPAAPQRNSNTTPPVSDGLARQLGALSPSSDPPEREFWLDRQGREREDWQHRRKTIADAMEQNEPFPGTATAPVPAMGKSADLWTAADKAVVSICELLGLLFGLPFGDDLYNGREVTAWHSFYLGIGIIFAGGGPMWPWVRTQPWFSEKVATRVSRGATDPLVWVGLLLLLFLYKTGPELYQRATALPPAPPVATGFTRQQVDAEIASALKTIQAKLDDMTRQRDAALSRQQQAVPNAPVSPNQSSLSAEDIATKIDIWQSAEGQMNGFINILNQGENLLQNWPERLKANRGGLTVDTVNFRNNFKLAQSRLAGLRATYPTFSDVASALDQRKADVLASTIQNFFDAISSLPSDLPENYESIIRPYAGGLNREITVVADWASATKAIAIKNRKDLSQPESK